MVTTAWDVAAAVPDPEIPVLDIAEMGILRSVVVDETGHVAVTITPTYSGCPATSVISMDIETAMHDRGIKDVRIKTQISPPWTTDWLSEKGRAKLMDYGIAPPRAAGGPECCRPPITKSKP